MFNGKYFLLVFTICSASFVLIYNQACSPSKSNNTQEISVQKSNEITEETFKPYAYLYNRVLCFNAEMNQLKGTVYNSFFEHVTFVDEENISARIGYGKSPYTDQYLTIVGKYAKSDVSIMFTELNIYKSTNPNWKIFANSVRGLMSYPKSTYALNFTIGQNLNDVFYPDIINGEKGFYVYAGNGTQFGLNNVNYPCYMFYENTTLLPEENSYPF